jgi:hypothetical protein
MNTIRLLTFVVLISATAMPWALAQDNGATGLPTQSPSISEGSYGTGLYGPGLTGPGSYGPGIYGPGSYNAGVGASTSPPSPFANFSAGGAAAGTTAVPSARSR